METPNRGVYRPMKEWYLDDIDLIVPTEAQLDQVEQYFEKYVFFKEKRSDREIITTCCNKDTNWTKQRRLETQETRIISYGRHNDEAVCPYCGAKVTLKNISKLGKKKNLVEYVPCLFVNEKEGDLYMVGAWAMKDYQQQLNEKATYKVTYCYHFTIGKTTMYEKRYGAWQAIVNEDGYNPSNPKISEPVSKSGGWYSAAYVPYYIIGIDNIAKSKYKYCQYETYEPEAFGNKRKIGLIKYLAIYSFYPRNVEMLMKGGMETLINDMMYGRKKNTDIIKWGEADPRKAFMLNSQELKEFLKIKDIELMRTYRKLKRSNSKATIELANLINKEYEKDSIKLLRQCKKYKVTPTRAVNYINKFAGPRCHGGYYGPKEVLSTWIDYTNMAEWLGYDMKNEVIIMPKELELAHNEASTEQNRQLEIEEAKADKKKMDAFRQSLVQREKKYNFEYEDVFVRVAHNTGEIVKEGKALKHCVGGYASRHVENKLTILFLREKAAPSKSMVTIEMNGNRLMQAHGFNNERSGGIDPREKYKDFFEAWLGWVQAGSPRTKEGKPKIPKKKTAKAA